MGRIGITYHEVTKAIATLQALQKNPTVDNIREVMGTGSKSTIARFLRDWKAKHRLHNDDDGTLPSDLLTIINGLWTAMQEKADNLASEYQKASDEKMLQLQLQLNQHRKVESELQQKIHALDEQNHKNTEESAALKIAFTTENQEKIQMRERASNFELRHQESQAENARLHQHIKHLQENLEHYQAATQKLRQEESLSIEKQRNEFDQQLSQLRNQLELITIEKTTYQAHTSSLNKNYEALESEQKILVLQHKEIQQQYTLLKLSFNKVEKDYDQLSKTHQQQSITLESKYHAVIELQLKVKSGDEKITSLESDLSDANNKIHNLRHEHQFTLQEKANLDGQLKQLKNMLSAKKGALVG
jgi:chromosome segregation ATPase